MSFTQNGLMLTQHIPTQSRVMAEISPERTKPRAESKPHVKKSVPVVYYLSRNGQLQHPHFIEIPLSSPNGLYLKDFIARLNVLRGRAMAPMYSWSCKRSYKTGFVWHDLSENDFVHPAHGHEYVLKGSELPPVSETASSDYTRRRNQSCSSIDFDPQEYIVRKTDPTADVSTQTEDLSRRRRRRPVPESSKVPQREEMAVSISAPPSDSSSDTPEVVTESDGRVALRNQEVIEEEPAVDSKVQIQREGAAATGKSWVLMKLISCGSISLKECGARNGGLGLISQYRMRGPRGGVKPEEYFSGSLVETKKQEVPNLKRSASYNAAGDR